MMVKLPPIKHPWSPNKIVLMSGLSVPTSCSHSRDTHAFLEALPVPAAWLVTTNFPCLPSRGFEPRTSLYRASLSNTSQFLKASRQDFRVAAARHWQSLLDATNRLLVITLSCGLEIANRCHQEIGGEKEIDDRVRILALGPVAWTRPRVPHTLVRGKADYISRLFFKHVDYRIDGISHMAYLNHKVVQEIASEWICNSILK